ncbi:flagellar basal body-associated FliL family protein [Paracraurococcus lichenis]|uniref:Flagellar protein FliL n=1 Tax=Paracraurococcus lichenis TaxID=3064888 RepID=A0ABT9EA97_9PROT|nr:flagellar basal body-associated FliL family protein [Paracraurococcus sp. LOR1-02]MDO9713024.1 flagellar basal body-associated FliL family protein [Paracraurococcus sp. LOR1-02]
MPVFRRRHALQGALAVLPALAVSARAAEGPPKREFEFLSLGDFTVNLPSTERRMRYVVVSITIETKGEKTQAFRELTPRLRQAALQRLLQMAQSRMLQPGQTDTALLREGLFEGIATVQEEGLKDVVITRLLHS